MDILTFLTGISSRDGERFPILRKAIRAVTNSEVRGLMKVIEELRVENTPLSTSIADHIESFTDYDFAHLLFSNGYVEQSISLEKQLNIIQVADLVLPDKETSFEEYTTMELLSFFGVDPEDENNQKRLRDLENGQCLISDLYGRVGVIQFHPVFEELLHAFDTRPPVRKEV